MEQLHRGCQNRPHFRLLLLGLLAEPEPGEPKLFGDLEQEINLNKHFLQSVWRMLGRRKAHLYLYQYSTTVIE